MKMKRKTFIKKRRWLNSNQHYDNGWIKYSVSHVYGELDANFLFADCSRTINLNFCCYKDEDGINHAKKLDTLIASLVEFREAMGSAWQYDQDHKDDYDDDGELRL